MPSTDELRTFYEQEYRQSYKGTRQPRLRHAARYFPAVAAHIRQYWHFYRQTDRILDIGSGSGEFVYLMRSLGKAASGLEPNQDYAEFCRSSLDLPISTGTIDDFKPEDLYQHIRLNHVVEHLPDPVSCLRMIATWLAPGGSIYVAVPDFETYCRNKTPGRMFHYGHVFNFDRDSFVRLASAAGLSIVERTGATSAFLSASPSNITTTSNWPIHEKLSLYEKHRSGQLRGSLGSRRITGKMIRSAREHLQILIRPSHRSLAMHAARSLEFLNESAQNAAKTRVRYLDRWPTSPAGHEL